MLIPLILYCLITVRPIATSICPSALQVFNLTLCFPLLILVIIHEHVCVCVCVGVGETIVVCFRNTLLLIVLEGVLLVIIFGAQGCNQLKLMQLGNALYFLFFPLLIHQTNSYPIFGVVVIIYFGIILKKILKKVWALACGCICFFLKLT